MSNNNKQIINIDDTEYYLSDYLFEKALLYTKGSRNARELIKKKNINENSYIYARNNGDNWEKSDGTSKKFDKILFACGWANENISELNIRDEKIGDKYQMVPKEIELEENEMFQDDEGNKLSIQVVGEREVDKCYFRVKDVGNGFKIKDLNKNILNPNSCHDENKEYIYFYCTTVEKSGKKTIKKEMYLTYLGILRVLFASHSKIASKFIGWATKTLFTAQMGTSESKQKLASKLLGVHALTIKEVFNTSSTNVPCIYLFTLGTVKDLRKSMKIDNKYKDDMIICKYGMTDSLERRASEHNKTYGSIKGANLCLKYYAYVDVQYISKAERDIREYFESMECELKYDNHKELIVMDISKMNKYVKHQYSKLSDLYGGHIKDLIKRIEELENKLLLQTEKHKNELQEEKHRNELQEERHKTMEEKHKNEIQKYEIELLKKELEISKMKKK